MMCLMRIALVVTVSMATMDPREENCLDALQKISPNSDKHALQTAATWLEDNFGAATAEDLKGVSNFAVDAMSLVGSDRSLSADAKRILRRLFLNEVEEAKSPETQRRLASSSTSSTSSGAASTTTTTTTAASTTTTASITATTTTTGPATTTTTVTTTTTTVATTTTTPGVGKEFTAKVTMAVEDTSWVTGDKAHAIMKDAIVASNTEVTSASQVTIMELKVAARRLVESGRRMAAGNVMCQYKVTFPSTYTGPGYTGIDTAAMKDKLQKNGHGVNIVVTSVAVVDTPSCAGPQCPTTGTTTMKVTTTQGSELSGAVAAQQLATSLAGILLLNLLSGF